MIAAQPLDRVPNLADADLHGAWFNRLVKGGRDYSPDGSDMLWTGSISDERVGVRCYAGTGFFYRVEAGWRPDDLSGSFSAWINLQSVGINPNTIFGSGDDASATRYFEIAVRAGGQLSIAARNNDVADRVYGNTVLTTGTWYHVVATSDGTAWKLYVDGVEDTPYTIVSGENAGRWIGAVSARDNITLGALWSNGGLTGPFYGFMKDARYYSRQLSTNEVLYQCRAGVPDDSLRLRLHRHRYDLSRYAAVYDTVGGVVLGNDVELNGTTGYLSRTVAGWRSTDHTGTVVGWIWRDATGAAARAIWASSDQGADRDFVLWTVAANELWLTSDSGGAGYNNVFGSTTISSGRWYHVALVSTGTEYLMYVNGEPETLTLNSGANDGTWLADCANRDNVTVGAWNHNGLQEYFFNGKIDDLRYYSEVKSGDWLRDDYRRNVIYR